MSPWREKLLGETRTSLLKLLRHAPRTVVELADSLSLSTNGVRAHISWLAAHGLVAAAGTQRDTGGKPARCYALTANGEELFPKGYAAALLGVMEEINEHGAEPRQLSQLMRSVGDRFAERVPVPAHLEGKVAAAADAVRALGGDVAVTETASGWCISGHGCPLSAAVATHPESCELIRAMIARVSGCTVKPCCDQGARPSCCFELTRP